MKVTRISNFTGAVHTLDLNITQEQMDLYRSGELVQVAFPQLSIEDREFILTGTTPEEWKAVFGEDEDELEFAGIPDAAKASDWTLSLQGRLYNSEFEFLGDPD